MSCSALVVAAPAWAQSDATPANAQPGTPAAESQSTDTADIVVTATRRAERLQDVPIAITAVSGARLAATGTSDFSALIGKSAGLAFTRSDGDRSANRLSIRGLSSLTGVGSEFPVVGAYLDEVPISDASIPDIGLVDLERVEVLRGPQGTLYGEGSMGGTIRYVTAKADPTKFTGYATGEASGTRGGGTNYRGTGAINVPLATDVAALRVAGFYERDGGFVDNAATGERNADDFKRYGVRGSLLIKPTDALSVTATGMYQRYEGGIAPVVFATVIPGVTPTLLTAGQAGPTTGYRQSRTFSNDRLYIGNLLVSYDLDFAALTSSTSYYDRSGDGSRDETETSRVLESALSQFTTSPLRPFFAGVPLGPNGEFIVRNGTQVSFDRGNRTFSQELRLASSGDSRFRWTLGGYYRHRRVFGNAVTVAPDTVPVQRVLIAIPAVFGGPYAGNPTFAGELQRTTSTTTYRQFAGFADATFALTKQIELTGGLRYLSERVSAANSIAAVNPTPGPNFLTYPNTVFITQPVTQNKLLYKAGISFKPTSELLFYGQVATGSRPGGLNERANPGLSAAASPRSYNGDSVTTYEVGAKTTLLNHTLIANAAAYLTDWDNIQIGDARDVQFPIVRNAAKARIKGFELELTARPAPSFEFGAVFAYSDAKFRGNAIPLGNGVFVIQDGQRLPATPKYTVSAFTEWRYPLSDSAKLVAYADVTHVSDRPASAIRPETAPSPGTAYTLPGYVEANAQLGVEFDRFTVSAFINNAFDEFVQYGGNLSAGLSRNKPRTIGGRVRVAF